MNFNRAFAIRNLRTDTIEFYFSRVLPNQSRVEHISMVTIHSCDSHASIVGCDDPPIRLEREGATQLMDDLWSAGIRPTYAKAGDDLIQEMKERIADSCTVRDRLLNHFFLPSENET